MIAATALLLSSCQKTTEVAKSNPQTATVNDLAATQFFICNQCAVTQTEDDLFGDVIDFYYNKKGNPDSLSYDGTPITLKYDKYDRLKRINFGTYAYFDFKYRDFFPLPVAYDYYYPSLGGIIAIDSFRYNLFGKITDRFGTNINNPEYNYDEQYTYDWQGNMVKTFVTVHNGGTVYAPGFLEFTASKFDQKPNFLGGNIWLHYLFFYSDWDASPYYYNLFSRNNAKNYKWYYDLSGDSYTVKSTFTYDQQGFATEDDMDFYDNTAQADLGIFSRFSTSSCDVTGKSLLTKPCIKPAFLKNKVLGLGGLPSPVSHK